MFHPSPFQWNYENGVPLYPATERPSMKRKCPLTPDEVLIPPPPEKHFVTEDEMTEEMRRLQIDQQSVFTNYTVNNYSTGENSIINSQFSFNAEGQFTGFGESGLVQNAVEDVEFREDGEALPKLSISQEVYKFKPEPILPASLLRSPSNEMALVPWVPNILSQLTGEEQKEGAESDDDELEKMET